MGGISGTAIARAAGQRLLTSHGAAWLAILSGAGRHEAAVAGDGQSLPPAARFLLYSITKTILAVMTLRLVARGCLALDATLEGRLPELPVMAGITLRQLLAHTSGLPDYGGLPAYHAAVRAGGAPWSESEFLARTKAHRLRFVPGGGWAYSNIGTMLVGRLLARVEGRSLEEILRHEILAPLGLEGMSMPLEPEDLSPLTFGPSRYLGDGEPVQVAGRYHPRWVAHGVMAGTALEAALVLHHLDRLLPRDLLEEMRHAQRVADPMPGRPWQAPGYGLGLMVEMAGPNAGAYGHTGAGPGCTPAVFHFPGKKEPLTVCVITNGEDVGQAERMLLALADLVE